MNTDIDPKLEPAITVGNRCTDYDSDCHDPHHKHLWCWKINPCTGVCPFLTGELKP